MTFILYLLYALAIFWLTAVFYTSVMHFKLIKDTQPDVWAAMHWTSKVIGYFTLYVGLVLDAGLNLILSVFLLDFPKEVLTTGKIRRLKFGKEGWRKHVALFFCRNYLIPFDAKHCE